MAGPGGGGGDGSGDLYGDLWIVVRDLDPTDGGGNGEPLLDDNGQIVPIGYDPATGDTFPIHLELVGEDYEVPAELLPYVQEIDLERSNIIRSPDAVVEAALEEALAKIEAGTVISTDPSGRIAVDGVLIDSPRECLALYDLVMKAGGATSWTEAQANAEANLPTEIVDLLNAGWNPTGLLAGVFSKFAPVTMDAVITAHTLMGVNEVGLTIDHYSFTDGSDETFDYSRVDEYGDVWVQWYQDMDGDPTDLESVQRTLLDICWGVDRNGDGLVDVGSGQDWEDTYMALSEDELSLVTADGQAAGINDWAQSVEDARAVILALHESVGATVVDAPSDEDDVVYGSSFADYIATWGGDDLVYALEGDDLIDGGEGNDTLRGNQGDDRIYGGAGDDVLIGNLGHDTIYRSAGSDVVRGGYGNDKLTGGWGADTIDGGGGDDVLAGGHGADLLTGGLGADIFVFREGDLGKVDLIADFLLADEDEIRLLAIDADTSTDEDDAFVFIGYADFTGAAGELRASDLSGIQRIEGDVDGDGVADFTVDVVSDLAAETDWFAL